MGCYCGLETKANKIKWLVSGIFFILFIIFLVIHIIIIATCDGMLYFEFWAAAMCTHTHQVPRLTHQLVLDRRQLLFVVRQV